MPIFLTLKYLLYNEKGIISMRCNAFDRAMLNVAF